MSGGSELAELFQVRPICVYNVVHIYINTIYINTLYICVCDVRRQRARRALPGPPTNPFISYMYIYVYIYIYYIYIIYMCVHLSLSIYIYIYIYIYIIYILYIFV
jgi:hypothetical protein